MNAADWDSCTDPDAMLRYLGDLGRVLSRKFRLFAVACCRRIWHLMTDPRSRSLVEVVERHLDGCATEDEWKAASTAAYEAWAESSALSVPELFGEPRRPMTAEEVAAAGALHSTTSAAWAIGLGAINAIPGQEARAVAHEAAREVARAVHENYPMSPERPAQCGLLRDIFGNPFRPLAPLDSALLNWDDGVVVQLAQAAYEERVLPDGHLDPARLAVLADALEEGGCATPEILLHLRSPGPHVRGCFVLDALPGRG
jgi:hypothetical protein